MSDTVKVEKPIPWVLSSVSLWRDILSGKPDTKANYRSAAEHAMSQRCKESPAGTERELTCWEGFSKGKPCKLGLHGYTGAKKKEKG